MSGSFGFENSASWGSAGVSLGLGLIEGQQRAQRHQEIVAAIQQGQYTNRYVAALEGAHLEAIADALRSKSELKKLEQVTERMHASLIDMVALVEAHEQTIERLQSAAKASATAPGFEQLKAQYIKKIEEQAAQSSMKDKMIAELRQQVQRANADLDVANKNIAALKRVGDESNSALSVKDRQIVELKQRAGESDRIARGLHAECKSLRAQLKGYEQGPSRAEVVKPAAILVSQSAQQFPRETGGSPSIGRGGESVSELLQRGRAQLQRWETERALRSSIVLKG